MRTVGIRELRQHTSEILREVQAGQVIDVTNRGATIARLIPVQHTALSNYEINGMLEDIDSLAAEISARWPKGLSVQDIMNDVRQ